MDYEMHKIRCWDWIESQGKIWITSPEHNGLFQVDRGTHQAKCKAIFNDYPIYTDGLYESILATGDNVICVPSKADCIAVYSQNSREKSRVRYISVRESEKRPYMSHSADSMLFGGYSDAENVFFFNASYPGIVRWDRKTDELRYVDAWLKELEPMINRKDLFLYFGDGFVHIDDEIYLPLICCGGLLSLNVKTSQCRIIVPPCEMDSYEGIAQFDGEVILTGRKADRYYLIHWNQDTNDVDEIRIPYIAPPDPWVSFLRPLIYKSMVYLLPTVADHFYVADFKNKTIEINERLEPFLSDFPENKAKLKVPNFKQKENLVVFQTWWNYQWYEYDLDTGEYKNFEVILDDEKYWQLYRKELCQKMIKEKSVIQENNLGLKSFISAITDEEMGI